MTALAMGVIGLGWFGRRHAALWRDLPQTRLVAVADPSPEAAAHAAEALPGVAVHADFESLLARGDIDAVSICLPDRGHEAAATAAARAGKATLLEKPLAHTAEVAGRIVDAFEAAGTRLMVGHVLRFDPRYVEVHRASAPERLGTPIHLRAKRNGIRSTAARLGERTSILFYMGVHDVDAMQWVARCPIVRVYARERRVLGTGNEDALYAVADFANGAIGSFDWSWAWPDGLMNGYRAALEVVGTRAAAYMDCTDQGFYAVDEAGTTGGDTHLWPEINGRIVGDLADELSHFATAVLDGRPFVQDPREAASAVRVLDALARSAATGMPVDVEGTSG